MGLASPFFFLSGVPATMLATGLQTACTQEMGHGRIDSVNRQFNETITFAATCMALLTLLLFLFNGPLVFLFGARGNAADLHGLTSQYLYGLSFDAAPFVLASILTPIVVLDNGNGTAIVASILGGTVNIACDILAVKLGFGLMGVGAASALSAFTSFSILATHFFLRKSIVRFTPSRFHWKTIQKIIHHGLPNAVHSAAGMLRSILLNALVAHTGSSIGISVLTIQNTVMDFVDILSVGVAGAVAVLTGIAFGEVNGDDILGVGKLGHRYILALSAAVVIMLTLFHAPIAQIFLSTDSEAFPLLNFVLFCIAVGTPFSALIYSRVSSLQAMCKEKKAQQLEALSNLIFLIAFAALLSIPFGARVVFLAFPSSKIVAIFAIFFFYERKSGKILPRPKDYLDLDPKFFRRENDMISCPFSSITDSVLSSEQIRLFCKGHQLDNRRCILSSLCAEEIMTNIVTHSRKSEKRRLLAEIRVTIVEGQVILCVKDNGMPFNLSRMASLLSQTESLVDNIGMKMICSSAEEINYYRAYHMNTTIIKV